MDKAESVEQRTLVPEEHHALLLAAGFWDTERRDTLPSIPHTAEEYERFTAAIVAFAVVRHELFRHTDAEYGDPEVSNILVGYDRPDMTSYSLQQIQKALDMVDEKYVHSLSRVGNGGLLHSLSMDATRRAIKAYLSRA